MNIISATAREMNALFIKYQDTYKSVVSKYKVFFTLHSLLIWTTRRTVRLWTWLGRPELRCNKTGLYPCDCLELALFRKTLNDGAAKRHSFTMAIMHRTFCAYVWHSTFKTRTTSRHVYITSNCTVSALRLYFEIPWDAIMNRPVIMYPGHNPHAAVINLC